MPTPPFTELATIGSGFAGLGMAIAVKRAGQHDFVIFEKGARVGDTRRVNQRLGCTCDVPSHHQPKLVSLRREILNHSGC